MQFIKFSFNNILIERDINQFSIIIVAIRIYYHNGKKVFSILQKKLKFVEKFKI